MTVGGTFASFRRFHAHHRRNTSDNSYLSSNSNSTSNAPHDMVEQTKSRHAQQKKEAREIWSKTQPLVRNDWRWPNPPVTNRQVDSRREYVERTITSANETVMDVTSNAGLKCKRAVRAATLDEMKWNPGLDLFEHRRKAWTGAVDVFLPPGNSTSHEHVKIMQENPIEMLNAIEKGLDDTSDDSSMDTTGDSSSSIDPEKSSLGTTLLPLFMPTVPFLDIAQPLNNANAERILYKNLVADGKTAVAPIPLANVIKACVIGMKENDEWPPKAGAADPLAGKVNKEKRRSRIKSLLGMNRDHGMNAYNDTGAIGIEAGFETCER